MAQRATQTAEHHERHARGGTSVEEGIGLLNQLVARNDDAPLPAVALAPQTTPRPCARLHQLGFNYFDEEEEPPTCVRMHQLGVTYFDGEGGPLVADYWMLNTEDIFNIIKCTDEEKVMCISSLFKDNAMHWWRLLKIKYADVNITWELLRKEFEKHFIPWTFKEAKMVELIKLVQGNMDVATYENKFIELSRFAPYLVRSEEERCRRFEQGLKPEIRIKLIARNFKEYDPLRQAAFELEQLLKEERAELQSKLGEGMRFGGSSWGRASNKRGRIRPFKRAGYGGSGGPRGFVSKMNDRPVCQKCGTLHFGVCWNNTSVCFRCGQPGHMQWQCSQNAGGSNVGAGSSGMQNQSARRGSANANPQGRTESTNTAREGRLNYSGRGSGGAQGSNRNVRMRHPAMKFGGQVVYCRTELEVENATKELLRCLDARKIEEGQIAVGFDIEWKPSFLAGVLPGKAAVMQICADAGNSYVMHIIHSGITPSLQLFLEDSMIVKVGVGICNDCVKIFKDYNVSVKAVVELSYLASQKFGGEAKSWSLQSLTKTIACRELDKPNTIRLGNWETDVLSIDQLQYAATDAFASWHLYQILKNLPVTETESGYVYGES